MSNKIQSFSEGLVTGAKVEARVTALEQAALYQAMLALLRRLEWTEVERGPSGTVEICHICSQEKLNLHKSGCELNQHIQVLESLLEQKT